MKDNERDDAVASAFDNIREIARRRGGSVPNLSQQGRSPNPRRSAYQVPGEMPVVPGIDLPDVDKRSYYRGPGRPSGPDGRRPRRSLDVPLLGAVVGEQIIKRGWQHELASGWVTGHWEYLVGEQIAEHTRVEMVKDGQLFISCTSTAWATNLKYMQRTILQSIAEKVGPGVITGLKIFGPKPPSWRKGPLHIKGRGPRDTYG